MTALPNFQPTDEAAFAALMSDLLSALESLEVSR